MIKYSMYALSICFFTVSSGASDLQASAPEENKYESLIHKNKNKIDIVLGACTGAGAMYTGSYVYQLIDQIQLKKSSHFIMASAGALGSGLATMIFYGGGEKVRNKLYELFSKNVQNEDANNTFYYESAFVVAYLTVIAGNITSELLLHS